MHPSGNLLHLLSTNGPPTQTEAASVVERLGGLRNEIARLKAQLQALQEEETRHLAVFSPVRRMPVEILGEIFLLANPKLRDRLDAVDAYGFCLVCKHWRDAALLMRPAWTTLTLNPWDLDRPGAYDGIVAWFSRSGNLPKRFQFEGRQKYCDCRARPCTTSSPVLQRLLKEGPAMHHLGLKLVSIHCLRSFVASMKRVGSTPYHWESLTSLEIAFGDSAPDEGYDTDDDEEESSQGGDQGSESGAQDPDGNTGDDEQIPVQWWDDFGYEPSRSPLYNIPPSVTSLRLHLPRVDYAFPDDVAIDPRSMPIRLSPTTLGSLTTLRIRYDWAGNHLANVLTHCLNVEDLTIDFNHNAPAQYHPWLSSLAKTPLALPAVRRLRLKNASSIAFLTAVTTPAIEELDLGMSGSRMHAVSENLDFCSNVRKFLTRSERVDGLQSLRIYRLWLLSGNIAPIMADIPSLRRLTLDRVSINAAATVNTLLKQVADPRPLNPLEGVKTSNSPLLPCLQSLNLLHVSRDFPFKGVIQCLERRYGDPPFCRIVGSYEYGENYPLHSRAEDHFDVDTLRKSGLSFSILHSAD